MTIERYIKAKSGALLNVLRSKLTGIWERGGVGGKNMQTMNTMIMGTFLPLPPWERGLISISPSTNVAWTYVSGRHVARAYYSKQSLWAKFQTSSSFNS